MLGLAAADKILGRLSHGARTFVNRKCNKCLHAQLAPKYGLYVSAQRHEREILLLLLFICLLASIITSCELFYRNDFRTSYPLSRAQYCLFMNTPRYLSGSPPPRSLTGVLTIAAKTWYMGRSWGVPGNLSDRASLPSPARKP